MLDAGEGLRGIVVLVVDVDIVLGNGFADRIREEALVHIALRGLGRELHHHARRRVGVHVGVLTGDVVHLCVDDGLEDLVGLRLAGEVALVAVTDVLLRHFLAGAVHQLVLHHVLDLLHGHLLLLELGDGMGDLGG